MTDNVLSVSLGQLTGLSGEVVQHSNVVKSFSSYSARQHQEGKIFELILNLRSAKAMELNIPEAFLATADDVIE